MTFVLGSETPADTRDIPDTVERGGVVASVLGATQIPARVLLFFSRKPWCPGTARGVARGEPQGWPLLNQVCQARPQFFEV